MKFERCSQKLRAWSNLGVEAAIVKIKDLFWPSSYLWSYQEYQSNTRSGISDHCSVLACGVVVLSLRGKLFTESDKNDYVCHLKMFLQHLWGEKVPRAPLCLLFLLLILVYHMHQGPWSPICICLFRVVFFLSRLKRKYISIGKHPY